MKTYMFLRNKKYRPCTYYRVGQYFDFNSDNIEYGEFEGNGYYTTNNVIIKKLIHGILVGYSRRILFLFKILLDKTHEYNILVQREVFPRKAGILGKYLLKKVLKNARNVYWDFDDHILLAKEISNWEFDLLTKETNQIFVGNENLKELFNENNKKKVEIVNTTDKYFENFNFEYFYKRRKHNYEEKVSIAWLGTQSNIHFLQEILPALEKASDKIKDKKIEINNVSNAKIFATRESNLIINNIKWTRNEGYKQLEIAHFGLMPLEDNEYTRGKCSFKAIQYMGAGLPIIISPVGMNKEVIDGNGFLATNLDDWEKKIISLATDKRRWEESSKKSGEIWQSNFNSKKIKNQIFEIMRDK